MEFSEKKKKVISFRPIIVTDNFDGLLHIIILSITLQLCMFKEGSFISLVLIHTVIDCKIFMTDFNFMCDSIHGVDFPTKLRR